MTIQQQAWRLAPGAKVLLCEASIRIGWIDAATHKPARIPPKLMETLK